MKLTNIVQRGNSLKAKLFIENNKGAGFSIRTSPKFVIKGSGVFQMKMEISSHVENSCASVISCYIFVRFTKRRPDDELNYTVTFTSEELSGEGKRFTSDDGTWHLLVMHRSRIYNFNISLHMDVLPCMNSFASLHEDTELTDFELRGTDGAVRVHRAVLAAASPVLRRMLSGEWRETAEGYVDVPGTTSATLQHLKDYLYLHTLPESGLEQLLLISSCYMMPDLKEKCVDKLVEDVSAANVWEMIVFAAKHKVTRLLLGILECVNIGVISDTDMNAK